MQFKLALIFILSIVIDSLVLSSLFNFKDSLLTLIVPIAFIIFSNLSNSSQFTGLILIAATENFRGLDFGSLLLPFVLTLALFVFVSFFLDIRYTSRRFNFVNISLTSFVAAAFLFTFMFIAGRMNIYISYVNYSSFFVIIFEFVLLFFLMEIFFSNKKFYNEKGI